ncbi:hypothetical protein G9A89_013259 [Geosiphon pyriformis]|nr:hypothetical protein G9A89_013259 [Geosiphon pyriformis]
MTQQNWKSVIVVHQLIPSSFNAPSGSHSRNSGTGVTQNPNSQNYLSLLVIPKDATINNSGFNQQQALTNNIPPATVTNDESLVAIFSFDLEEMIKILLFSGAVLEEKPITIMYTDAKINGHTIKLILDSRSADSIITKQLMNQLGYQVDRIANAKIITVNGVTKTSIGKIDNLPIIINGITVPIKVLGKERKEKTTYQRKPNQQKTPPVAGQVCTPSMSHCHNHYTYCSNTKIVEKNFLPWKLGSHQTKITGHEPTIIASLATMNGMATQKDKTSGTTNHVSFVANSCLTKECGTTFLVEEEYTMLHASTQSSSVTGCASELELPFNPDSNSNNDDNKNTGSSSVQIGNNNNDDDSNSNSNSNPKYEQYIALPDLFKEQKLKWYSDNNEGIIPECVHDTDAGFDLKYPEKDVIKLEPHSCICINLKVVLRVGVTS